MTFAFQRLTARFTGQSAPCLAGRFAGIAAAFLFFAGEAFAQGTLQPVQSTLQTLVQALTGPIATSLAILAVIACGFLAFTGRLTWGIAGSVIFGIVLVFGSAQIVQFFQSAVGR
ncbi:MAG: TrbC/VirB2 family protein [Microcystis sp. LE19-4.1E]|nr:TrbC/VirB2 family protein [Microcystis sp. LE19-4.1E]